MVFNVAYAMCNMPEFDRTDTDIGFIMGVETALCEYLDLQVGGIPKDNGLSDARRNVGAALVFQALTLQRRRKLPEVAIWRNLKRDPVKMGRGASLKSDCLQSKLRGEKNPIGATVNNLQPDYARP